MLGPPRQMEHACQLGWVPAPTQQPECPQVYLVKFFECFFALALHMKRFFLSIRLKAPLGLSKGIEKSARFRSGQGLLAYVQGLVKAGVGP